MKCGILRNGLLLALIMVTLAVLLLVHPAAGESDPGKKEAADAYKKAYQLLLDKDYSEAKQQFEQFLKDYKNSSFYDDASYWRCYAFEKTTKDMEKAFDCYIQFIETFPESKWREEAIESAFLLAKKLAKTNPEYKVWIEKLGGNSGEEEITLAILMALLETGDEDAIIELLDKTDNPDIRRRIVHALAECGSVRCLDALSELAMSDPDTDVRRHAVYALGDCDSRRCMEQLLEIAKGDPDTDVRRHAVYALSNFEDEEEVVQLMIEILKSETDPDIRRQAVYVIVEAEDPRAVPALIEIALNDTDVDAARAATYGLAEMDDPRATDALIQIVKESGDADMKRAALYALVELDDVSILPTLKEIALNAEDPDLVRAAVYAIAEMDDEPEAARALIEIFRASKDPDVKRAALYGIADHDNEKLGVELLKEAALSSEDKQMARVAVYALEDVLEDEDVDVLMAIYEKSPFEEVRRAALLMILDIGVDEALPTIKKVLKSEVDPDIRAQVIYTLEDAGDEDEVVKMLIDVAENDPSRKVRRAAVHVLGEIGTEEAQQALLRILQKRPDKND
jgi:HEAT repeat protein